MNFIELTLLEGIPIVVNLNNVVYIENLDNRTFIRFNTEKSHYIEVKESFADIQSIIEALQRRRNK